MPTAAMTSNVLPFRPAKVTGSKPKPLMWQCKCGSQQFSFTEAGDVYCAGTCQRWMLNLRVEKS